MGKLKLKNQPQRLVLPRSVGLSEEKILDGAYDTLIIPAAFGLFRDYVEMTKELPDPDNTAETEALFHKCLTIADKWSQYSLAWKKERVKFLSGSEDQPEVPDRDAESKVRKVIVE